jgi:protein-L-isoaspartate(D-aspartate) O-methyltransferase
MHEEETFDRDRDRMVEEQLLGRDITDRRVLEAMRTVPRHEFVREEDRGLAYADAPLPIGHRQTISQPYIVALMTQLLSLRPADVVLEVGTGSGYQAAVLAALAQKVYTLERIAALAEQARQTLERLAVRNVEVIYGDGSGGLPAHAPYPAIIVTAAAPKVPEPLLQQLAEGGRLVLPVGSRDGQVLERWTRQADDNARERIAPVAFVPLVGAHGWAVDEQPAPHWIRGL